jgi:hypothetical protein
MGDVDSKFDKFVENYNLDMKILLTKLDSMFLNQIQNKPTNQIEYDNNDTNSVKLNDDQKIVFNDDVTQLHSKLDFSSDDSIEKNLLIDRMLNDNFCLLNKNLITTNSASIINNSSKNLINSNLKSILIKSSSIHKSDNINISPEAGLIEKYKIDSKSQINSKQKRVGIKKQLTFGEDMLSGIAKRNIIDDISDTLSLNLNKVQIELPNKSDNTLTTNIDKDINRMILDQDTNNSNLIVESENSSIHDTDDDDDDDINEYGDKIYSNVLLKEENEQKEKSSLKSKYKNDFNKNTDL